MNKNFALIKIVTSMKEYLGFYVLLLVILSEFYIEIYYFCTQEKFYTVFQGIPPQNYRDMCK